MSAVANLSNVLIHIILPVSFMFLPPHFSHGSKLVEEAEIIDEEDEMLRFINSHMEKLDEYRVKIRTDLRQRWRLSVHDALDHSAHEQHDQEVCMVAYVCMKGCLWRVRMCVWADRAYTCEVER